MDNTAESESGNTDIISRTASEHFNITGVLPYQRLVISNILEGCGASPGSGSELSRHFQIVILPTGMGKSLCFILPGILISGMTLIIFPLLSLMADQERRLNEAGLASIMLRGGEERVQQELRLEDAGKKGIKFIFTNPEMLQQQRIKRILATLPIDHAVIDEAHTVSQWGESFRPSYRQVGPILRELGIRQITAFTATASESILRHIRQWVFPDRQVHLIRANPDRPNITYRAVPTICRLHDTTRLLDRKSGLVRPVIVFCATRADTERLFRLLRIRLCEDEIFYYHAGLCREDRKMVETRFHDSETGILFATSAYGMGIDKKNVRSVLHFDLARSIEAYLQETGRAGRDFLPATATALIPVNGGEKETPLLAIFRQHGTCWRKLMLKTLDSAVEHCSGCDVCSGNIQEEPRGLKEIVSLIRRNRLKLTRLQAAQILCGRYSHAVVRQQLHTVGGFGNLAAWELDDIEDAIGTLLSQSALHESKLPLWKYRLRVAAASL